MCVTTDNKLWYGVPSFLCVFVVQSAMVLYDRCNVVNVVRTDLE